MSRIIKIPLSPPIAALTSITHCSSLAGRTCPRSRQRRRGWAQHPRADRLPRVGAAALALTTCAILLVAAAPRLASPVQRAPRSSVDEPPPTTR